MQVGQIYMGIHTNIFHTRIEMNVNVRKIQAVLMLMLSISTIDWAKFDKSGQIQFVISV